VPDSQLLSDYDGLGGQGRGSVNNEQSVNVATPISLVNNVHHPPFHGPWAGRADINNINSHPPSVSPFCTFLTLMSLPPAPGPCSSPTVKRVEERDPRGLPWVMRGLPEG